MKASLLVEMKLGGNCPQYTPIRGAVFEFPSYKVNESSKLELELNQFDIKEFSLDFCQSIFMLMEIE